MTVGNGSRTPRPSWGGHGSSRGRLGKIRRYRFIDCLLEGGTWKRITTKKKKTRAQNSPAPPIADGTTPASVGGGGPGTRAAGLIGGAGSGSGAAGIGSNVTGFPYFRTEARTSSEIMMGRPASCAARSPSAAYQELELS